MNTADILNAQTHTGGVVSPAPGDPRFKALLDRLWELHRSKGSDYGTAGDTFANYHRARKMGVKPSLSVLLRMNEKWSRVESLTAPGRGAPNHESIEDNLLDLSAQALIAIILLREEAPSNAAQILGLDKS